MNVWWLPEHIVLAAPEWSGVITIVATLLAVAVLWNYVRMPGRWLLRTVAAGLKLVAIGLLCLCVLQPMVRSQRGRPQANLVPILVDTSPSMTLQAGGGTTSRAERFAARLATESPWLARLTQDFDVRTYQFDDRLSPRVADQTGPSLVASDGSTSTLKTSLMAVRDRFAGRPVGGLILMSDGIATDIEGTIDWSTLGFPVYPIVDDSDDVLRDLRIDDVSVSQTDFETAPVTVTCRVRCDDTSTRQAVIRLIDQISGRQVQQQTITLTPDQGTREIRFRFRPGATAGTAEPTSDDRDPRRPAANTTDAKVGVYRVDVYSESDADVMKSSWDVVPKSSWEATLANNRRLITIDQQRGPYRILYVAGRPNWEYKFLRRALQEDPEIQLVALLRIANKEPKFTFRDSQVNSTNPLFAGLGDDVEEAAAQYDEPVMIRLGVRESEELSEGFPKTSDELFDYQAVILDDIETGFFTADQLAMLRRFVASRGGGLMFLGGQESFAAQSFQNTPLGELSPVYASRVPTPAAAVAPPARYRWALTREGLLQPWVRLREDESAEQQRLSQMPPFASINPTGDIKPGATVMARVDDGDQGSTPALVIQQFGKGRTAAMPLADMWRWSMRRGEDSRDDAAQAWRQIAHWLVGEVPRRIETTVVAGKDASLPVQIVTDLRDPAYLPLDNADVALTVTRIGQAPLEIKAVADDEIPGRYVAQINARDGGAYVIDAQASTADGVTVGDDHTGFARETFSNEFRDLRWNRTLLEDIAAQTGGEVVDIDSLEGFAADLPNRKVPVMETWTQPLWHRPLVMLLAIGCLCGEWGLRRWRGME